MSYNLESSTINIIILPLKQKNLSIFTRAYIHNTFLFTCERKRAFVLHSLSYGSQILLISMCVIISLSSCVSPSRHSYTPSQTEACFNFIRMCTLNDLRLACDSIMTLIATLPWPSNIISTCELLLMVPQNNSRLVWQP